MSCVAKWYVLRDNCPSKQIGLPNVHPVVPIWIPPTTLIPSVSWLAIRSAFLATAGLLVLKVTVARTDVYLLHKWGHCLLWRSRETRRSCGPLHHLVCDKQLAAVTHRQCAVSARFLCTRQLRTNMHNTMLVRYVLLQYKLVIETLNC